MRGTRTSLQVLIVPEHVELIFSIEAGSIPSVEEDGGELTGAG
jgi:hypothetical protein